MRKKALRFHFAGSNHVARRSVADEGVSLSAGLGSRSVFASHELCGFRQVALPLWMVRPNPSYHPLPCRLLYPLPPRSFCIGHTDLSSLSTSRPLSLLFPLLGIPFLAGPTLSSQCSPGVFLLAWPKKVHSGFSVIPYEKNPNKLFGQYLTFLAAVLQPV